MPRLAGKQKEIFVAELVAQSIISTFDLNGELSANFHVRHKIRSADITGLAVSCMKYPAQSYERVLSVAYLIAFACAAYNKEGILSMINNKKWGDISVTPHYDDKSFPVSSLINDEPMNLWFGLAKENTKSGKKSLDVHILEQDINIPNILVGSVTNSSLTKSTDNDHYLLSLASGPNVAQLRGKGTVPPSPAVQALSSPLRVNTSTSSSSAGSGKPTTPMSKSFSENHRFFVKDGEGILPVASPSGHVSISTIKLSGPEQIIGKMNNMVKTPKLRTAAECEIVNKMVSDYVEVLERKFSEIVAFVDDTSVAGKDHYDQLISQLNLRGYLNDSREVKLLSSARDNWQINRASLKEIITAKFNAFKQENKSGQVVLTKTSFSIPNNFFLTDKIRK